MKFEWKLRDELLVATHYWPLPTLAFLIGCLIGWAFSVIIPSHYRAERTLSVAYNADAVYRNPDDYKNWQLKQLDALAFAGDITSEALAKLQNQDPYWKRISIEEFASQLQTLWRNTGVWRFTADSNTPSHAREAVRAWTDAFLNKYQQAFNAANEMHTLDQQLKEITLGQSDASYRLAALAGVKNGIQTWLDENEETQATGGSDARAVYARLHRSVNQAKHWRLWSLVSLAAGYDPAWQSLLQDFPTADAPLDTYSSWIEKVLISIDNDMQVLQKQIDDLEPQREQIGQEYQKASEASRGLSATIIVAPVSTSAPEVKSLRPTSLYILIGGFLGMIVWSLIWLSYRRPGLR